MIKFFYHLKSEVFFSMATHSINELNGQQGGWLKEIKGQIHPQQFGRIGFLREEGGERREREREKGKRERAQTHRYKQKDPLS